MQKITTILLLCLVLGAQANAQSVTPGGESNESYVNTIKKSDDVRRGTQENPTMTAVRISTNSQIKLDGFLDEAEWQNAPYATDLTQRFPVDGGRPSQRTEARILYTDSHIYVGVMAYESNPDSITKALFRRDGNEASDWVYVSFDSYNDKRTAFTFAVNPSGVQKDILYYDDNGEDILWDAVWEASSKITNEGWSVEMKIPLSQLRFSSNQSVQTWGVNFQRRIARNNEFNYWSETSQRESGMVSKFGRLYGIRDLEEPRRLEITPYVSSSITREPGDASNPYYNATDVGGNFGGDIKYGITSDLTLTATINPDFGQVEADPATINLSQFEIFFPERRPFFLEGSDIFRFGRTNTNNSAGNPNTFYSRRIGRTPQGNLSIANAYNNGAFYNADSVNTYGRTYRDVPDQTSIAAAAKLSGKTQNGWSIGVLNAITLEEEGDFTALQGANLGRAQGSFIAEPTTNYLVSRVKKDINEGNTVAGGFLSAVNRRIDNTYFETYLRNSAYIAGADFEHNWDDRKYVVSGTFSVSQINGTPDVITNAQMAPQRYYQRVDSDELSVDATKTSLEGYAGEFSLRKASGDHFTGSVTYSEVSPGYETNDIGFQNRADYRAVAFAFQWQETSPKHVQYWEVWNYHLYGWNFDGDAIWRNFNVGGFTRFKNNWHFNMNVNTSFGQYSDRLTRGGPIMKVNGGTGFNFNVGSDRSKDISFGHGQYHRRDVGNEFDDYYWADISFRPATNIQLTLEPQIGFEMDEDQFVANIARDENAPDASQTFGRRYIFADSRSMNFSTEIRLNWTFNPSMSLQTFVRPFINSFKFSNFGEFKTPGTFDFDRYGKDEGTITDAGNGNYQVDIDNNGESDFDFRRSDFTFRSLQGNAVFRWEYKPGSTLFLVWQQSRNGSISDGRFNIGQDIIDIFDPKPSNIFLVKLSYWLSS
ncbi:MAG: carbohydrate binding family 9 domain-containing protein [Balneolaceae bacterium]|nr:carbohydrate binding family 9 domain-containing protein [Balneolaceae bacterium]